MAKLLIFDWDGTLCDSLERIAHCMQLAADDVGLVPPTRDAVKEIVGLGLYEAFAELYPGEGNENCEKLREAYSKHFVEQDHKPSPFFEGVEEVLIELREKGYLLAVATGKSRRGLNRVLQNRAMTEFFHGSRCADETMSKPHPMMLHQLLDEFTLQAHEAVMVGDTEFDMAMAESAEMPRIAVSYGAHHVDRLRQYNPFCCADDFFQVGEAILDIAR